MHAHNGLNTCHMLILSENQNPFEILSFLVIMHVYFVSVGFWWLTLLFFWWVWGGGDHIYFIDHWKWWKNWATSFQANKTVGLWWHWQVILLLLSASECVCVCVHVVVCGVGWGRTRCIGYVLLHATYCFMTTWQLIIPSLALCSFSGDM